jgi:hypothetical protein
MLAWLNIIIVIKHTGGYGKWPFTRKDARNNIDKYRREKLSVYLEMKHMF